MIKNFYLLVTCFILTIELSAQDTKPKTDIAEIRKNDYQIELGFRSIKNVYDNTTAAIILFKKKFRTGDLIDVTSIKFLRAYFSINTQLNFEDDPTRSPNDSTNIEYHPSNVTNFTLGIGLEKQFQNKKFVHYYGSDLFTNYLNSDDDYTANGSVAGVLVNFTASTDREVRSINAGLIPFLGIKYYITDQFSLGLETGINLSYFNTKITEVRRRTWTVNGVPQNSFEKFPSVISNGLKFDFLGLRFFTIGYSFK